MEVKSVGTLVKLIKLATSHFNPKQCYILSKIGESKTVWGHSALCGGGGGGVEVDG